MLNLSLDLMRATEAGAIAASKWVGTGDKLNADKAATEEMQGRLNQILFSAQIVIGEGKKDKSFGLFNGDKVGKFAGMKEHPQHELAVDPIDGTRPTVKAGPEALSVIAISPENSMFTTEEFYMNKLAYGPEIAEETELFLEDPVETTITKISEVTGKDPSKLVVCILDRPRHDEVIKKFRAMNVRLKLIQDCDISGAIATCLPDSGIDLLYGIGGAPEAVITACAMKCLKGGFKAQVVKPDGKIVDPAVYSVDDMVKGPCAFAATGITNGSLLRGVRFTSRGPVTNSVMMRSESGTVRWVTTYHGN